MLVVHKKDLQPVASNHDPIENVEVFRLLTDKSLPEIESGKMPYINWAVIPPGRGFSPHRHGDQIAGMTEFFVIIKGEGEFTCKLGNKITTSLVTDGDMICASRGEIHSLKNSSDSEPLTYICFGVSTGGQTILES
jgi:mannose-6-phosphate isomerase-like protein (cupin superfamily)